MFEGERVAPRPLHDVFRGFSNGALMKPEFNAGCHARTETGVRCRRSVVENTWFCAAHQGVSTLDALWEVEGKVIRLGDMPREQVRGLMDVFADAAAQAQQRATAETFAAQRNPYPAKRTRAQLPDARRNE